MSTVSLSFSSSRAWSTVTFTPSSIDAPSVVLRNVAPGAVQPAKLLSVFDGAPVVYTVRMATPSFSEVVTAGFALGAQVMNVAGDRIYTSAVHMALREGSNIRSIEVVSSASSAARALTGNGEANTLKGGIGSDVLRGLAGNDVLEGGNGNDSLLGGLGSDVLVGGLGNDTLYANDASSAGETFGNLLDGGDGRDLLVGSNGADKLFGGAAADTLRGGGGADSLYGGLGNDSIDAGSGNDHVVVETGSRDFSVVARLGSGNDRFMASGPNGNATVYGDSGHDVIEASAMSTIAYGGADNDVLHDFRGHDGTDRFYGDSGNDLLISESGADSLYGGLGNDWFVVNHEAGPEGYEVRVVGGEGHDTVLVETEGFGPTTVVSLEAGNDVFWDSEAESVVYGGTGNDVAVVMGLGDMINGGDGNDVVFARGDDSELFGGSGNDAFFFEAEGRNGEEGTFAVGGTGADLFVFAPSDHGILGSRQVTIMDFNPTQGDRIALPFHGSGMVEDLLITRTSEGTELRLASQDPLDPSAVVLRGYTGPVTDAMFTSFNTIDSNTNGWNLDPGHLLPVDSWPDF